MLLRPIAGLALLLVQPPPSAGSPDHPVVQDVVLEGVTVYERDDVLRALRLTPGEPLPRDPDALAASLTRRYRNDGYPAARVSAVHDPDEKRLTLTVDEGRLTSLALEGLSGRGASRARRELDLQPGAPLREQDLLYALRRLEAASDGALWSDDPPYRIEPGSAGVHLVVRLRPRRAALAFGPRRPAGGALAQRVDGVSPWAGGELTLYDRATYDHVRLYARGGYGFASERGGWVAGVSRSFGGRLVLGGEVHDFTDTDDRFRAGDVEETLGTLLFRSSFRDYFRRRGSEAYGFFRLSPSAQLGVGFRRDRHLLLDGHFDWSLLGGPAARPNRAADPGRLTSLLATARVSIDGPLFDDPSDERDSFLSRDLYGTEAGMEALRAEASWEVASARRLGGDFTFTRLIAQVRGRREVGARNLGFRVLAGFTGGEPPAQRRFALGGLGTLRGLHYKDLVGDDAVLASLEFGGWPGFPRPGLVVFYDGGAVWSRGTAARWRDDVGLGLVWGRGARAALRFDLAFPLSREAGRDRVRATLRLSSSF
jgi:hypothetical protein